jgi:hypothetical protein
LRNRPIPSEHPAANEEKTRGRRGGDAYASTRFCTM